MRTHVKCVGRCLRRQFVTIISIRRRAVQTASRFVAKILISSSDEPCFGMVISVRVSISIRFFTAPFAPIIAPKNALNAQIEKINWHFSVFSNKNHQLKNNIRRRHSLWDMKCSFVSIRCNFNYVKFFLVIIITNFMFGIQI